MTKFKTKSDGKQTSLMSLCGTLIRLGLENGLSINDVKQLASQDAKDPDQAYYIRQSFDKVYLDEFKQKSKR